MPFDIADNAFSCKVTTIQVPYALNPKIPNHLKTVKQRFSAESLTRNQVM
jgi:hypothetical protein